MSKKSYETYELIQRRLGRDLPIEDITTLRKASLTLRSWFTRQCGSSEGHIAQDEENKKWYQFQEYPTPEGFLQRKHQIPDLETGARKRIHDTCARLGLHYYIQTDPRGLSLYIHTEPLPDDNYTIGLGIH